jgi:hypothetical protein
MKLWGRNVADDKSAMLLKANSVARFQKIQALMTVMNLIFALEVNGVLSI